MAREARIVDAADWTQAALEALARGGLAAVAVEPLAKELGATKGSFYWHFADRNELIAAALEPLGGAGHGPRDRSRGTNRSRDPRLRGLVQLVFTAAGAARSRARGSVELALQANATHPLVAATLPRVTERRLAYLTALFTELGLSPARARNRGLLAYSAFLGHAQIAHATPSCCRRAGRTPSTSVGWSTPWCASTRDFRGQLRATGSRRATVSAHTRRNCASSSTARDSSSRSRRPWTKVGSPAA